MNLYQFKVQGSDSRGNKVYSDIINAQDALDAMEDFMNDFPDFDVDDICIADSNGGWLLVYDLTEYHPMLLANQAH